MGNYNRDLLVLFKADAYNEDLLQQEVECLHKILLKVESNEAFCMAHELARRTFITQKAKAIIRAISKCTLKPFYFLINKN